MDSSEASTNPFLVEGDDSKFSKTSNDNRDITYHDIATKLLNDNLLLTALELHAELVESGKDIPKLRVFFSNPGNFEQHTVAKPDFPAPSMPRSLSQATLDSLDLTRYSEDGERGVDERVAILEFELRKAKETINALRANLTVATESETPTADGITLKCYGNEPVKPHEQRALNFLINEYLLIHGYKLTSITFADENENQDFEDWDDVGLNISKPAELSHLYREYMRHTGHHKLPGVDATVQTNENTEEILSDSNNVENLKQVVTLQEQCESLKREKQELEEKLWKLVRASEESEELKVAGKGRKEGPSRDYEDGDSWTTVMPLDIRGTFESYLGSLVRPWVDFSLQIVVDLPHTGTEEDQMSADIDWTSVTMSTPDPLKVPRSDSQSGSGSGSACEASETRGLTVEDEDRISADAEWTPIGLSASQSAPLIKTKNVPVNGNYNSLDSRFERSLSSAFRKDLLTACRVDTSHLPQTYEHLSDILMKVAGVSGLVDGVAEKLVLILARTLPKLLPCIILNKREEVIPLLVVLVRLHSDSKERDILLHHLFNLKKRPDDEERQVILAGLMCVAEGMEAAFVENEVLPQCWEQINHKYVERRLLVAESCGVLAPFVTGAIRNSLMLSMLQQMLSEDREEIVRATVVRAVALIAAMSPDCDKYSQCEDLVISCVSDTSASVINCFTQTLLPVVAQWALTKGQLQSSLLMKLLNQLSFHLQNKCIQSPRSSSNIPGSGGQGLTPALNAITALTSLLPFLVLSVANVEPVLMKISPDLPPPLSRVGFSDLCRGLANPVIFHCGNYSVGQIMAAFDVVLKESAGLDYWPELIWISDKMLPAFINALSNVSIAQEELLTASVTFFRFLCAGFGPYIVVHQIKPIFMQKLQDLEQSLVEAAGLGQKSNWPSLSVLVVYLGGVLSFGQSEAEMEELRSILKKFLMALPLCSGNLPGRFDNVPIDGLRAAISSLCSTNKENVHEAVLTVLWEGVVSQRAPVRCAAAALFSAVIGSVPEKLVASRVAPALVTLASDPDVSVKTAAVPTFGKLITTTSTKEVKEKVCFQLQCVLSDPATRDSHSLLLQLVATLGQVVASCDSSFREDVILPQLAGISAYTSQLQNLTRRLDLAVALIDAFSAAVYISLPVSVLTSAVLPGLRYLEEVSQQLQPVHRETILAMMKEVESRSDLSPLHQDERRSSRGLASATANMNQGVEDMRQRMSKIFQPKNIGSQPTLPNLFRKK